MRLFPELSTEPAYAQCPISGCWDIKSALEQDGLRVLKKFEWSVHLSYIYLASVSVPDFPRGGGALFFHHTDLYFALTALCADLFL